MTSPAELVYVPIYGPAWVAPGGAVLDGVTVTATVAGRSRVLAASTVVATSTTWVCDGGELPGDAVLAAPPVGALYYRIVERINGTAAGSYEIGVSAEQVDDGIDLSAYQPTQDPRAPLQVVPGPVGPRGPATSLDVVAVRTGAAGSDASVVVSGDAPNQHLEFTVPEGRQGAAGRDSTVPGPKGDKGDAGDASTAPGPKGDPGADSTVPGPKGDKGDPGAASTVPGPKGDKGDTGAASTVPGPKGDKGDPGAASTAPGPKGDKGDAGAASTIPGPKGDTGMQGPAGYPAGPWVNDADQYGDLWSPWPRWACLASVSSPNATLRAVIGKATSTFVARAIRAAVLTASSGAAGTTQFTVLVGDVLSAMNVIGTYTTPNQVQPAGVVEAALSASGQVKAGQFVAVLIFPQGYGTPPQWAGFATSGAGNTFLGPTVATRRALYNSAATGSPTSGPVDLTTSAWSPYSVMTWFALAA